MSASPSKLCRPKVGGGVGEGIVGSFKRLSEFRAALNKRSDEAVREGKRRGLVIPMNRLQIVVWGAVRGVIVVVDIDAKNSENLTICAPPTIDIDLNL
jgi:hypothetical protein